MLNIINHQINANQSHKEIPLYTSNMDEWTLRSIGNHEEKKEPLNMAGGTIK